MTNSFYIQAHEYDPSAGNRVLRLLVNRKLEAEYAVFERVLLPALHHFGFPYTIVDLATYKLDGEKLEQAAALVLAHDGVMSSLSDGQWEAIESAVRKGCGALSWDGALWRAKAAIRRFFGAAGAGPGQFDGMRVNGNKHYIGEWQDEGGLHRFRQAVAGTSVHGPLPGFETIATDPSGRPLVVVSDPTFREEGKRASFQLSPVLWLRTVFGHASGLDDLLWRSVVWVARKPFAALLMPPFVTCRIDDVSGSYDHFDYVRVLNENGWIPNLGLFLDDLDEEDRKAARRLDECGKAQFSAHSFHELGDPAPDQIYLRHDGTEYDFDTLGAHFRRLDRLYEEWGLRPSRTVNIHYDELGLHALPFLYNRRQDFTMGLIPPGVAWSAASYSWEPYPYGHQGFNYGPLEADSWFFNVVAHHLGGYKTPDTHMGVGEFLGGCTVFNGENDRNDVPEAIERAVTALKIGVSSRFFGTLMTHEQRVAVLGPDEWRALIAGIAERLKEWPESPIFESYDRIAAYCKGKRGTRIVAADAAEHSSTMTVRLAGAANCPLSVAVFTDRGEGCECRWFPMEPFEGEKAASLA